MMVHLIPTEILPVPEAKLPPFPLANRNALRLPSYAAWRGGGGTRVGISAKGNRSICLKSHAAALTAKDQAVKVNLCFTLLSLGIFPSASSLALACLRLRMRWYCLALTYKGSSSSISAPGRGIRCIVGTAPPPGTI